MCGKGTYKDNYNLLFNVQLMCFMKREYINKFFKDLKKNIIMLNSKIFYNTLLQLGQAKNILKKFGIIMI